MLGAFVIGFLSDGLVIVGVSSYWQDCLHRRSDCARRADEFHSIQRRRREDVSRNASRLLRDEERFAE